MPRKRNDDWMFSPKPVEDRDDDGSPLDASAANRRAGYSGRFPRTVAVAPASIRKGDAVVHRTFGDGIVREVEDVETGGKPYTRVTVEFSRRDVRPFLFPEAFLWGCMRKA